MPPAKARDQRIRDCLAKHPEWANYRIASATDTVVAEVAAARGERSPATTPQVKPRGITLEQFRAKYDVRERIRAGIKALAGVCMSDPEFREACGILPQDWRRFADLDEFEAYRWRFKGVLYWAQPKMLAAMKDTVGAV